MLGNVSSLLYESPSNSASFISENFKKMFKSSLVQLGRIIKIGKVRFA